MKVDLEHARQVLPLPALMGRLGYGAHVPNGRRNALCPFHAEKTPSFSVYQNGGGRFSFHCFGCGIHGDEVDFIMQAKGISKGEAIREYGELAGVPVTPEQAAWITKTIVNVANEFHGSKIVSIGGDAPCPEDLRSNTDQIVDSKQPRPSNAAPTSHPEAQLAPLSEKAIAKIAAWRGYSVAFVAKLSSQGKIGSYKGNPAFRTTGGLVYRLPDRSWRFTPGARASLMELGEPNPFEEVYVCESVWDCLSLYETKDRPVICTRGAANYRLALDYLYEHEVGRAILVAQNDEAGQKLWLNGLSEARADVIEVLAVPNEFKDYNEWMQKAAKDLGGPPHSENATQDESPCAPGGRPAVISAREGAADTLPAAPVLAEHRPTTQTGAGSQPSRLEIQGNDARESTIGQAESLTSRGCGQSTLSMHGSAGDPQPGFSSSFVPHETHAQSLSAVPESALNEPSEPRGTSVSPLNDHRNPELVVSLSENVIPRKGADTVTAEPLSQTLDAIVAFLARYVTFALPEQAEVVALWVAFSWVFQAFRFAPSLHVCSAEKRSGKTRLLECIELLVPKPRVFIRPSEAVLFRTIEQERPTLILDEIDTIFGKDAEESSEGLRAVLNAGFQSGSKIPRCVGNSHEIKEFNVFCCKVLAGIGRIPDTVRDRCIDIRLNRQTNERKAERFRMAQAEAEAKPLFSALQAWANS